MLMCLLMLSLTFLLDVELFWHNTLSFNILILLIIKLSTRLMCLYDFDTYIVIRELLKSVFLRNDGVLFFFAA